MLRMLPVLTLAMAVLFVSNCFADDDLTVEEMKTMMVDSTKLAETYKYLFEVNFSQETIELKNPGVIKTNQTALGGEGAMNITGRSMEITINSSDEAGIQPSKIYIMNDTVYFQQNDSWSNMSIASPDVLWSDQEIIRRQEDLVNRTEMVMSGTEEIEGDRCYRLKVIPDSNEGAILLASQVNPFMNSSMPSLNTSELFQNISNKTRIYDWTVWISQNSHLLRKSSMKAEINITPEILDSIMKGMGTISLRFVIDETVSYSDYNSRIEITLPPEATGPSGEEGERGIESKVGDESEAEVEQLSPGKSDDILKVPDTMSTVPEVETEGIDKIVSGSAEQIMNEGPVPITTCGQVTDAFSELTRDLSFPDHLADPNATKMDEDFDVSRYFSVLNHISMEPGYVLDYVYLFEGIGGEPIIYARKADRPSYRTYDDYAQDMPGEDYFDHIQIDGTPEGYFEYVMLHILGNQFYLFWHANYNDYRIVCDSYAAEEIFRRLNESSSGINTPTEDDIKAAAAIDCTPSVEFKEDTTNVRVVLFTDWGGLAERNFTISRDFPHKILNVKEEVLIPYNCGISF